ncbi:MAG: hypothetical protein ABI383_03335 [Acidobacteriaceae bacterium]
MYSWLMSARVTAKAGLLDVLDRPLALTVEILWRWLFGSVALLLTLLAAAQAFAGVVVTEADQSDIFLSGDPTKAVEALRRLIAPTVPTILHQLLWLTPLLMLFWLVLGTLGRAAACSALTLHRRADWGELRFRGYLKPVARLQGLRVVSLCGAISLAVAIELLSVRVAASSATANASIYLYLIAIALLWGLIGGAWLMLNFLLAIAPAMLLRPQGTAVTTPFRDLILRWRRSGSDWLALTIRFAGLRALAYICAFSASLAAAGMAAFLPFVMSAGLILLILLAYFAVADTLFLARLSAYSRLGEHTSGDEIYLREP